MVRKATKTLLRGMNTCPNFKMEYHRSIVTNSYKVSDGYLFSRDGKIDTQLDF